MDQIIKENKTECFCLVQLTRIGDVLQTIQAANQLRKVQPQMTGFSVKHKKKKLSIRSRK